jgi:hypothetical protein
MGTISASLLDKHREINVDHDWWDFVYEDWFGPNGKCKKYGLNVSVIDAEFSGFSCQGDGASFTGSIEWKPFLEAHPELRERYRSVMHFIDEGDIWGTLKRHTGRYSHSNMVYLDIDDAIDNIYDEDEEPIRHFAMEELLDQMRTEIGDFQDDVLQICRGYMDELYGELEEEYEYQTSDEAVTDTLECNGIYDEEEDDDTDEDDDAEPADHEPEVQVHAVA